MRLCLIGWTKLWVYTTVTKLEVSPNRNGNTHKEAIDHGTVRVEESPLRGFSSNGRH